MRTNAFPLTLVIGAVALLLGCGRSALPTGPAGGGTSPTGGTQPEGTISGTATFAPMSGAVVTAYAIDGGVQGAALGSATTDDRGMFTVSIGSYSGAVMLQMTGGSYTDDATHATMAMQSGSAMTSVVPSVAAGSATAGIQVTPLTSMAQAYARAMTGGMTPSNVSTALADVGGYFSVTDVLHVMPMNPLVLGAGATATQDEKNYGMTLAAMSEYAAGLGMTDSSGIVTPMMEDASDGVLNGMMGSTPISMSGMGGMMGGIMMQPTAGTSGLATAMAGFVGSAMNVSGVTAADMQPLMDELGGCSGQLQPGTGTPPSAGTISGTAVFGHMSDAMVSAYAVASGAMGSMLGSGTTDGEGHFTVAVGGYAGTVMLRISGGSYMDVATGTTMTMQMGDVMTAVVPSMAAGATLSGVEVTPLTSMAQLYAQHLAGGMTDANVAAAMTDVGGYFSVSDVLHVVPMDPLATGSGAAATGDEKDYGMVIAAMSQYAASIGMPRSSGIVTAMMEDASDGVMDGEMAGAPITLGGGMGGMMGGGTTMAATAGTSGLATAMGQFIGSSANVSGVATADMQVLMDKLAASSGALH